MIDPLPLARSEASPEARASLLATNRLRALLVAVEPDDRFQVIGRTGQRASVVAALTTPASAPCARLRVGMPA